MSYLITMAEETTMSDTGGSPKSPSHNVAEMKFKDMNILQKGAFVCKAMVFLITFGMAFPNIFSD